MFMGFNPRPRVGGDDSRDSIMGSNRVSIHAPAWGATLILHPLYLKYWFQSTPPRGGRPVAKEGILKGFTVSIHAPAWGATLYRNFA